MTFNIALTLATEVKQVAVEGMARSTITREAAVQESIGWNRRLPVPDEPSSSR